MMRRRGNKAIAQSCQRWACGHPLNIVKAIPQLHTRERGECTHFPELENVHASPLESPASFGFHDPRLWLGSVAQRGGEVTGGNTRVIHLPQCLTYSKISKGISHCIFYDVKQPMIKTYFFSKTIPWWTRVILLLMNISLKIFNVHFYSSLLLINCGFNQQLLHNVSRFLWVRCLDGSLRGAGLAGEPLGRVPGGSTHMYGAFARTGGKLGISRNHWTGTSVAIQSLKKWLGTPKTSAPRGQGQTPNASSELTSKVTEHHFPPPSSGQVRH